MSRSGELEVGQTGYWKYDESVSEFLTVVKVTKTQVTLSDGSRCGLSGKEWGGTAWSRLYFHTCTKEEYEQISAEIKKERIKKVLCRQFRNGFPISLYRLPETEEEFEFLATRFAEIRKRFKKEKET